MMVNTFLHGQGGEFPKDISERGGKVTFFYPDWRNILTGNARISQYPRLYSLFFYIFFAIKLNDTGVEVMVKLHL